MRHDSGCDVAILAGFPGIAQSAVGLLIPTAALLIQVDPAR